MHVIKNLIYAIQNNIIIIHKILVGNVDNEKNILSTNILRQAVYLINNQGKIKKYFIWIYASRESTGTRFILNLQIIVLLS